MKISHLKRLSAIAALLLCLTGTASAANSTGSGAAPSAEAKAALDKAIQEEEENAKKTPISVEEARKIVADNNLYQDIDLSAFIRAWISGRFSSPVRTATILT